MSFVNSPSSDVSHDLDNFLNVSMPMPPAINHIYPEDEIPSENHSHENYLTPSAGNSDPYVNHASMVNTSTMLLTQHGVTPETNSMNFQEGGFSVGNLESRMMSIASKSILKDSNEEIGDLRQHGVFTCSGDTNFQEISTRAGNHDTLGFPNKSVLKDSNEEIEDLRQQGEFVYSGDTNFQETSTRAGNHDTLTHASMMNPANMLFTRHGVTPAINSMNFQGGRFSVGNLKPRMMMSIASTSSHEAISEGQVNYSNQESEGLLNPNRLNDLVRSRGIKRSLEAREKGTEEQCDFQQPLESKNKRLTLEQLGQKDGKQINKIITDRLNRQIEQDKKSDMELVHAKQWPVREDVQVIRQEFKKIAKTYDLKTNEAKRKLLGEAINLEIKLKAREDSGNPSTNMDYIVNNLGLYFEGPFIEAVKKKFSPDLGNGRSARSPSLASAFNDLKNQVYVQGNKQVEPEDFQGLPEELKKLHWGEIPSYLQPIVSRIVTDIAKVEFSHTTALVLFCAAVKEMEDFPTEKLDLDMLKKWGATLKKAKEVGFQVGFADDLLSKNLLAYFAHTQILEEG